LADMRIREITPHDSNSPEKKHAKNCLSQVRTDPKLTLLYSQTKKYHYVV